MVSTKIPTLQAISYNIPVAHNELKIYRGHSTCGELSVLITYVISCTYHFLYHCFHKCCVMCAFSQLLLLLWYDNLLLGVLYNYKRATSQYVLETGMLQQLQFVEAIYNTNVCM